MLVNMIAEMLADRIGCDASEINESTSFKELGIDSLDIMELLMNLEDAVGVTIDRSEKIETVGELVTIIENRKKEQ